MTKPVIEIIGPRLLLRTRLMNSRYLNTRMARKKMIYIHRTRYSSELDPTIVIIIMFEKDELNFVEN